MTLIEDASSLLPMPNYIRQSLRDEKAGAGGGVKILQVETDIYEDHPCYYGQDVAFASPIRRHVATRRRDRTFAAARSAAHATATGSLIKSKCYGLAPHALLYFLGSFTVSEYEKGSLGRRLERFCDENDSSKEFQPGDIVSISLQMEAYTEDGTKIYVPVDADARVGNALEYMVREQGLLVFAAAGNNRSNGRDLCRLKISAKRNGNLNQYDIMQSPRVFKVGFVNNDKTANPDSNVGRGIVSLAAPAESVRAACYDGDLLDVPSQGFTASSAATPMVASTVACMQSIRLSRKQPKLTYSTLLSEICADQSFDRVIPNWDRFQEALR